MRTVLAVAFAMALAAAAAADIDYTSSPTQQPGIVPQQGGVPWLLGSVSDKIQVSHTAAFGFSSGGSYSGPSGLYMTHLAYPLSNRLNVSASFGIDWNPSYADVTGRQATNYGLRELRLDWRPSEKTHVSFGYVSYPSPNGFLLQRHPYRSSWWRGGLATWGPDTP
jgi:hypothetical protein